ncbi:MAG: hydantoinase/oxoprolinase family protein, partial [Deltaproteobacteria bacterium]|nr:hydantoinase/oxoprolinase family protein [Deltaproteobacteria bacterium]
MFWVGFDVGGTFVDLVAIDLRTTDLFATKVPSSPTDAAGSVERGLRALLELAGARPGDVSRVVHGTTMATNALIERKGARVGMITTAGFRDVVHIGRMLRDELFDVMFESTPPLAERDVRLEVNERVSPEGVVRRALDTAEAEKVVGELMSRKVDAVAVCLLHSYANPSHEITIGEAIARAHPGLPVSLSHRLSMEYSEYERWTTTVVNAYLMPRVTTYLRDLARRLATLGIPADIEIVQSNGGIIPLDVAARFPVRLLASGPAGGVAGAARFARSAGLDSIITFDMGGTSTDVCVVREGRPQLSTERKIDGYPIRAVMSDVHSIGAGGGSIATLDASGTLRVGPESAGASPGPVAYSAGGSEPTVTD